MDVIKDLYGNYKSTQQRKERSIVLTRSLLLLKSIATKSLPSQLELSQDLLTMLEDINNSPVTEPVLKHLSNYVKEMLSRHLAQLSDSVHRVRSSCIKIVTMNSHRMSILQPLFKASFGDFVNCNL
jgi:hypothetical protein